MAGACPICGGEKEPVAAGSKRSYCKKCAAARARDKRATNPEKCREASRRWQEKNPDKVAARNKAFYAANRDREQARAAADKAANAERVKLAAAAWRKANKERFAAMQQAYRSANLERLRANRRARYANNTEAELRKGREYKAQNKAALAAKSAAHLKAHPEYNRLARSMRRAAEKSAMPKWADKRKMAAFYREACRATFETGISHRVDHIVPLQSKWVCGLHCETNLQVLPGSENQSKKNRYWPDMPVHLGVP